MNISLMFDTCPAWDQGMDIFLMFDICPGTIGACRAVWVPGQDLAMPHLIRNCRSVLSLHCRLYVRLYVRKHAYAGLRACRASSRPVLVI